MKLLDLIEDAGAEQSLASLASKLNLGTSETRSMVDAVAPALMRSLQKQASSPGGLAALAGALQSGGHQKYVEQPAVLESDAAIDDGNRILGHLFGSKDVSRNVAANAAGQTGIDSSLIKKALPLLAGLAMGALSKKSDAGRSAGSLLPDLLGGGDDGFGVDDVLNLARKFF
jgi:hypothetical protein